MGKTFEKLLLAKEILSPQELEFYKKKQSWQKDLPEILRDEGVVTPKQLKHLLQLSHQYKQHQKTLKRKKKDESILRVVRKTGIIREEEVEECLKRRKRAQELSEDLYLVDIFLVNGYLTPYLVRKFSRSNVRERILKRQIPHPDTLVVEIPTYLKEKFLSKIILKSNLMSQADMATCRAELKKRWPHQQLAQIIKEKKFLTKKHLKKIFTVIDRIIYEHYPHFDSQVRDIKLAKLLAKHQFLSPWRLNKCLYQQLQLVERKKYVPLRQILEEGGYLASYQFDTVLKNYGELVKKEHFSAGHVTLLERDSFKEKPSTSERRSKFSLNSDSPQAQVTDSLTFSESENEIAQESEKEFLPDASLTSEAMPAEEAIFLEEESEEMDALRGEEESMDFVINEDDILDVWDEEVSEADLAIDIEDDEEKQES